jgi:FlaA1/EpsC-like NDP-sugar epimerase
MCDKPFEGKRLLVTGGTGSLGKVLVGRLLSGELGRPEKVIVFSRDEAKQHFMRVEWQRRVQVPVTDEIIYKDFEQKLEFRIGDVRDAETVAQVLREVQVVFNAAAMKQVPTCEYAPYEAVRTNVGGAKNIVRAIEEHALPVETVVGISTDKACKPVNVMGMTKALQERIFIQANLRSRGTRYVCVRYGNVLASRGSVIPLFREQIQTGGPVTITTPEMTRFLLSLNDAVDTVFAAVRGAHPGETYVPRAPSALILNVAQALVGSREIEIKLLGLRPGEKIHEILISEEEVHRTMSRGGWYAILPMLPELRGGAEEPCRTTEYSSAEDVMSLDDTAALLKREQLMVTDGIKSGDTAGELEMLR